MASIYENQKSRISVSLPYWLKKKGLDYLMVYGKSYTDFVEDCLMELRISLGTADSLHANYYRDVKETVGKVLDRYTGRNELEGRKEQKTPDFVVHRISVDY